MPDTWTKYRKLASYARPYWITFGLMLVSVILLTALRVYVPLLLGEAVQDIVDLRQVGAILPISLEIIGISAVSAVFQYGLGYGGQSLGQKIIYDMRNKIFSSIQNQSFSFHDRKETGQLMSRATGDVEAVRRLLAFGSAQILGNLVLLAGVVVEIFYLNLQLALIVVLPLPIIVYISWRYSQSQAPHWKRARDHYGAMNSILQQNILGMRVVRSFSAEEQEIKKFHVGNAAYRDDIIGAAAVRSFFSPMLVLILNIAGALVYLVGGFQVIPGSMGIGTVIAAANLVALLVGPVRFLGQLILIAQNGMAGFDRVLEITDADIEVSERQDAIELERGSLRGNIEFRGVTFEYAKNGAPSLRDVNLEIHAGEAVAFVGATGSGKTTAANLIPRFYDPTSGSVQIDGIDVRDFKLKSLRTGVGIVSQDIFLFSATVRENIAYGMPEVPLDRVIEAARIAHADEFVERFPEKYDTLVGERGVTLSGGQKQRIAIARTLVTDPKILILDDSLSSVDVETERAIQESLKAVIRGRTSIIITQRMSSLRLVDRIVVFADGRVVELGTHAELLKLGGAYAELYNSQLAPYQGQRESEQESTEPPAIEVSPEAQTYSKSRSQQSGAKKQQGGGE